MNPRDRLLLEVLSATDGTWLPQRSWAGHRSANTRTLRAGFGQGLPWVAGGIEADRKAAHRLRDDLVAEGLLLLFHPRRTRVPHLKLTDAAELALRRRVGLPGMYGTWLSLLELAKYSRRPATRMEHAWVCEWKLIGDGVKPGTREASEIAMSVENMLVPALVRGLARSNATGRGLVYYMVSEDGWRWLDAGVAPVDDDFLPDDEIDGKARNFYEQRVKVNVERLQTATPTEPQEIGAIPLPDGGMRGPLLAWCTP